VRLRWEDWCGWRRVVPMAGDAFSRLKTQVLIFFSVTVKKKFDTRTRDGQVRLGYFVGVVLLLLFMAVSMPGEENNAVMMTRSGGLGGGGGRAVMFEDDEDDDESDALGGGGDSQGDDDEDDEDEGDDDSRGDGDGDDEDDDEGDDEGGAAANADMLKTEQQQRQGEMKAEFTKFFESTKHQAAIKTFIQSYEAKYSELGILSSEVIGSTHEKRELTMYTIGNPKAKKEMVVIGSEHGCEWSVPMYLTYVVTRLVQLYGINEEVTSVLDNVRIHVMPYVNPDGAQHTLGKTHDARHYTKNRAPIRRHSSTKGVDLKVNWMWNDHKEIVAVKTLSQNLAEKGKLSAFVGVQCCRGVVQAPRNATCVNPGALEEQKNVGNTIAQEMHIAHDYHYELLSKPGHHPKINYDGFAVHWAQNTMGVNLAFTLSAAPTLPESSGKHKSVHHLSSKKQIEVADKDILTGSREITKGVVALGKHLANKSGRQAPALCGQALPEGVQDDDDAEEPSRHEAESEEDEDEDDNVSPGEDAGEDDEEDEDDGDGDRSEFEEDNDDDDQDASVDQEDEEDEDAADFDADAEAEADDTDNDDQQNEEDSDDGEEEDNNEVVDHSEENEEEEEAPPALSRDEELSLRFAKGTTTPRKSKSRLRKGEDKTPFQEGRHDVANAMRFAQIGAGVDTPVLEHLTQATLDGTGPHFLYFAYGPDMLYEMLVTAGITSAVKVVNAQLDGFGLDFTYYSRLVWKSGIADLYKRKSGHVLGVLYRIDKSQRALLDQHNLAASADSHVAPVQIIVGDKEGNVYPAMTYRVPLKMPGTDVAGKYRRFKPSRQYRNCIVKGAKQHHLPEDYIDRRIRSISPLFSDKIGSTTHRNPAVGTICDPAS